MEVASRRLEGTMTDNSQVQDIRNRVDGVLATRHDALYTAVRACVADVLAIDGAKVTPEASLIDDLGAESLDFLDLVFRLETEFGVKIPRDGIRLAAQEGLAQGFDEGGVLTAEALTRLRLLMPEVAAAKFAAGLRTHEIANLFTAETFVRLVAWRLADTGK
jgi:acyl carrier protein